MKMVDCQVNTIALQIDLALFFFLTFGPGNAILLCIKLNEMESVTTMRVNSHNINRFFTGLPVPGLLLSLLLLLSEVPGSC